MTNHPIAVNFLDDEGEIRYGELVNPCKVVDGRGAVEVEFYGDNTIDVIFLDENKEERMIRTHISRVSSMKAVSV